VREQGSETFCDLERGDGGCIHLSNFLITKEELAKTVSTSTQAKRLGLISCPCPRVGLPAITQSGPAVLSHETRPFPLTNLLFSPDIRPNSSIIDRFRHGSKSFGWVQAMIAEGRKTPAPQETGQTPTPSRAVTYSSGSGWHGQGKRNRLPRAEFWRRAALYQTAPAQRPGRAGPDQGRALAGSRGAGNAAPCSQPQLRAAASVRRPRAGGVHFTPGDPTPP